MRPSDNIELTPTEFDLLFALARSPGQVLTRRQLLQAVALGKLLANAVRHAPAGGAVEVRVSALPSGTCIDVRDDGPGIAVQDLAEVFTRYRKAADSGGSGLGLTIARDLVAAHGGTIEAHNNAPAAGATITVRLPVQT